MFVNFNENYITPLLGIFLTTTMFSLKFF